MKFKRNGKPVTVNWNPKAGIAQPFENVLDDQFAKIKYLGKNVVEMDGKHYQVQKWHWNFHPALENEAVLAPLDII